MTSRSFIFSNIQMQLIKQEGNDKPEYIDGTIENDTIISTKGLYKILNKVRNRGLVLYNV